MLTLDGSSRVNRGHCRLVIIPAAFFSAHVSAQESQPAAQVANQVTDQAPSDDVIIVRASKQPTDSIDSTTYRIENTPEAAVIGGLELLNRIPFVSANEEGITLLGRSGVRILVDGNAVPDPTSFLRSLRAKQIEAIEVVSNPSSRYAANAQAGVINIRLRRVPQGKFAGTVNGSIDTSGKEELNFAPTFTLGDVSFLLSGIATHQPVRGKTITERPTGEVAAGGEDSVERYDTRGRTDFLTASGTASYAFAEKQELKVTGYAGKFDTRKRSRIRVGDDEDGEAQRSDRSADEFNFYNLAMSYETGSKATKHFKFTATVGGSNSNATLLSVENGSPLFRAASQLRKKELSAAADRILNFKKSQRARFGASFGRHRDRSDLAFKVQSTGSATVESGRVELDWNELAAYADYQFTLKKFHVLLGLRVERRDMEFGTTPIGDIAYFGLFPSLHLEREFGNGLTMRASYSRRVSWPSFNDLNPVARLVNATTVSLGNPDLKPPISHSLEWSLQRLIKNGELGLTLYHKRTQDTVSVLSDFVDGVLVSRAVNAGSAQSSGASLSVRGPLLNRLTYQLSADIFHDREQFDFPVGGDRSNENTRWGTSLQLERRTGTIGKPGSNIFQVSGTYRSERDNGFTTYSPQLSSRVSWTHQLSNRVSTVVTGTNLVATRQIKSTFRSQDQAFEQYDRDFEKAINFALVIDLGAR